MLTLNSFRGTISKRSFISIAASLLIVLLLQACSTGGELEEGAQAPDFRLPSSTGEHVAMSDMNQDRPVLLYFHMALG